ncbi:PTS transporter subunit EIIB, partial [Lactobacillus paragasseri]
MKDEQMCKEILKFVGGKSNIAEAYHCITRLRLNVRDLSKVKVDEIKKINGVLTVQV